MNAGFSLRNIGKVKEMLKKYGTPVGIFLLSNLTSNYIQYRFSRNKYVQDLENKEAEYLRDSTACASHVKSLETKLAAVEKQRDDCKFRSKDIAATMNGAVVLYLHQKEKLDKAKEDLVDCQKDLKGFQTFFNNRSVSTGKNEQSEKTVQIEGPRIS